MFIKKGHQETSCEGIPHDADEIENWRCSARFPLPVQPGKSWRLAEGFQSQNAFLVVNIGFARPHCLTLDHN